MRTLKGEWVGVDPLVGRICTNIEQGGRTVYGPYHRIVGGASVGDVRTDLMSTSCGLDLPFFDTSLLSPSFLREGVVCGDCFSA